MITVFRAFALAALLSVGPAANVAVADTELDEVLARFDEVQESIQTLAAQFTETTRSRLLRDDSVARGSIYLTKPDSVRWEYTSPEEMRFVIAKDEYTGYFPARKRAEKRAIHRWSEQLFRILGIGQGSAELLDFYEIRLGASELDGTILLELEPRKKRVRKRVQAVRLWINGETYLPDRVEYTGKKGDGRLIEFEDMRVNPELAASLYSMEIPADVKVTKGFSALSGVRASSSR